MQKILSGNQVKLLDEAYVSGEGISSYQLMERAAHAFCDWFVSCFSVENAVSVFCGTGNNGGDGLAIARILHLKGYTVMVGLIVNPESCSTELQAEFQSFTRVGK